MRRLDLVLIALGLTGGGLGLYVLLTLLGVDSPWAGIGVQGVFTLVLLGWLSTYLWRVGSKRMTYHQQRRDYEEAVLQKRLEELTPEELAQLQSQAEPKS